MEQALSWDKVRSAPHGTYPTLRPFLQQLDKLYQKRTLANPDFIFMREQVNHLDEVRKESSIIPLQEQALKKERDEAERWQIDAENRRRAQKDQSPIKKLSELDEELEKDPQGRPINPEAEAMLVEGGRILLDSVFMQLQYSATEAPELNKKPQQ